MEELFILILVNLKSLEVRVMGVSIEEVIEMVETDSHFRSFQDQRMRLSKVR
jgi:hypothetical protein